MHPRHAAQIGLVYLKEAVLRVLLHEPNLRPHEISQRLDIPRVLPSGEYKIVNGVLDILKREKRVQSDGPPNTPYWDLTETERNLLELLT